MILTTGCYDLSTHLPTIPTNMANVLSNAIRAVQAANSNAADGSSPILHSPLVDLVVEDFVRTPTHIGRIARLPWTRLLNDHSINSRPIHDMGYCLLPFIKFYIAAVWQYWSVSAVRWVEATGKSTAIITSLPNLTKTNWRWTCVLVCTVVILLMWTLKQNSSNTLDCCAVSTKKIWITHILT